MKRMNADTVKHNIDLEIDDQVTIVDGPFKELEGKGQRSRRRTRQGQGLGQYVRSRNSCRARFLAS